MGGLRANPTPGGVPVEIKSPTSQVADLERWLIRNGTLKIRLLVFESCKVSPLSVREIRRLWGSGISSAVTIHGPVGAKVSQLLPRYHCLSLNCMSRALTSCRMV